ncbi:MAG: LysR family transcriptional regulator [Woeseiaceae bacterium]|nr:LysR family transcriptional regulator [Woeseiaceae bacterium]
MAAISHLRALQAIELALRTGSMKAAAEQLSISPAAVGQRIRSLEDYLGFDLLVRGRSGIRPTVELEVARAHLNAAFRELETVHRLLDFQRVHEVHVVADSDWAELWLRPRLKGFKRENPNTLLCINGTGDVPVRVGDADCEVWFGQEKGMSDEELLFHDYLAPISSPENTARISSLPEAERLEGFPLLHLDSYTLDAGEIGWKEWTRKFGRRSTAPDRGIRYKRVQHALEAVYANAGLVICGIALVRNQIQQQRLSMPFSIEEGEWSESAYRVKFRQGALRRTAIERFREWLLTESQNTADEIKSIVP